MNSHPRNLLLLFVLFFFACKSTQKLPVSTDDGQIEVIFLQINDVYEIAPLEGGKIGGMARLATLRQQLLLQNKNTFTVHAGDFVNPSLIGTLTFEGQPIKGRQMVEAMNAVGVDLVTFGNHEFDIKEAELQQRINESQFDWTSANVLQNVCDRLYPFYKEKEGSKIFIPETYVYETHDADGTPIKIGIFSVTLPSNPQPFVYYEDYTTEALKAYEQLSRSTDLVLGLTHLEIDQDLELAQKLPNVPLIMGGHDHENMRQAVGNTLVTKADANAKSAYVHRISFNHKAKKATIKSELILLDEKIALDPEVDVLVQKWNKILLEKMQNLVPDPLEVIYRTKAPLDGRESQIRNHQTTLGDVITQAMLKASTEGAVAALQNSGSIRIDDQISGEVTPIDIFRVLPFGGSILDVEMTGALLQQVLDYGQNKKGNGAYLQLANITAGKKSGQWLVGNEELVPSKNYKLILNDFLLMGLDIPFLTDKSPGIVSIVGPTEEKNNPKSDVRIALINYLRSL